MRKIFEYFFGKYFRTKLCKTAILAKLEKLKKNEGLKKCRNRKFLPNRSQLDRQICSVRGVLAVHSFIANSNPIL